MKKMSLWVCAGLLAVQGGFPAFAQTHGYAVPGQPHAFVAWREGRAIENPTPIKQLFKDVAFAQMVADTLSKLIGTPISIEDAVTQDTLDRVKSLIIPAPNHNRVESLEGIGHLRYLEEFLLGSQAFKELPDEMRRLTQLKMLHLSANKVETLPDWIGDLTNLTYLNLHGCGTSGAIPESIGKLTQLEGLQLDNNDLSGKLPEAMVHMTSLKMVTLQSNRLEDTRVLNHISALSSLNILPQRLGEVDLGQVSAGRELRVRLPEIFAQAHDTTDRLYDPKGVVIDGNSEARISDGGHYVYLPTNIIGRPVVTLRFASMPSTAITYTYDVR